MNDEGFLADLHALTELGEKLQQAQNEIEETYSTNVDLYADKISEYDYLKELKSAVLAMGYMKTTASTSKEREMEALASVEYGQHLKNMRKAHKDKIAAQTKERVDFKNLETLSTRIWIEKRKIDV